LGHPSEMTAHLSIGTLLKFKKEVKT